ncbi:MAG TPA: division/cell wall cluster transcriptional repressor MraZ [Candidatus Binatia bacterium]|nr:division/cell wall cluster transcriptional repressor MraZ [Candidatus Binatia bacterium]
MGESGETRWRDVFTGHHQLSIDDKGRLAIPARFRQQLADRFGHQVFITIGDKACLEIYPVPEFQRIADSIALMDDQDHAEILKLAFIGRAVETEIDKQGRVSLPPMLRKAAGLDGSAVVVGQITRLDVWPEERWNAKFADGPDSVLPSLRDAYRKLKR